MANKASVRKPKAAAPPVTADRSADKLVRCGVSPPADRRFYERLMALDSAADKHVRTPVEGLRRARDSGHIERKEFHLVAGSKRSVQVLHGRITAQGQ